jgi:hypothetical protein
MSLFAAVFAARARSKIKGLDPPDLLLNYFDDLNMARRTDLSDLAGLNILSTNCTPPPPTATVTPPRPLADQDRAGRPTLTVLAKQMPAGAAKSAEFLERLFLHLISLMDDVSF